MTKITSFAVGVLLSAVVATLIITQHRYEIGRLQEAMKTQQEHQASLAGLAEENARLSNLVAQATTLPQSPQPDPAAELLRLRGQVGRLRQDHDEVERLRAEIESVRLATSPFASLTLSESFARYHSLSVPKIPMGATKSEALAELQRAGAKVLNDENEWLYADLFPVEGRPGSTGQGTVMMELFFETGKLASMREERRRGN